MDLKNEFLNSILYLAINEFADSIDDFFDSAIAIQRGLFIGLLLSSMLIFFVVMQVNILALNGDIWKSKRLLALYPIQKMTQNMKDFKNTLAKLS